MRSPKEKTTRQTETETDGPKFCGRTEETPKKQEPPPDKLKPKPTDRGSTDDTRTHIQTSDRQKNSLEGDAKYIPSPTFEALATASRARSAASDAPPTAWPGAPPPPPPPHLSRSSLLAKSASFGSCETAGRWRRRQNEKGEPVLPEHAPSLRKGIAASRATRWICLQI